MLILRTRNQMLLVALVVARVASALTAVPAYLVDEVPRPLVVLTAIFCVLTAVACAASWCGSW